MRPEAVAGAEEGEGAEEGGKEGCEEHEPCSLCQRDSMVERDD